MKYVKKFASRLRTYAGTHTEKPPFSRVARVLRVAKARAARRIQAYATAAQARTATLSKQPLVVRLVENPRAAKAGAVALAVVLGMSFLNTQAKKETDARKSADVVKFEKTPDEWLDKPATVEQFRSALDARNIAEVALVNGAPGRALYTLKDGKRASVLAPGCTAFTCEGSALEKLNERSAADKFVLVRVDVDLRTQAEKVLDFIQGIIRSLISVGVMIAALMLFTKFSTGAGGSTASKLAKRPETGFADVIGNSEAKSALGRVLAFMKDPERYTKVGAAAPRGVLMVGPPGTGKTLLAKALAGESKSNFIAVDGSYFSSMFYGAGISKVRDLFKLARENAPCVLFIDEIDGIGKRRQGGEMHGGDSEANRIINRILVEMDGFASNEGVIVVGATNHENNMDEAMRRPGRFDTLVRLKLPTLPERRQLFDLYLGKVVSEPDVDTAALSRMSAGMSPADVANTVNKAASCAAEQGVNVGQPHLEQAIETYQLGGEVSPIKDLLTEDTRQRLAFHEGGHALAAYWFKAGSVDRVTIEPRGQALGVTYVTRETEDPLWVQADLTSRLAMMLAGREAELLMLGSVSTGASDDLKRASELAIEMVANLGFSQSFGLLSVAGIPANLLGPDIQSAVLTEARRMLEEAQTKCRELLVQRRTQLEAMAQALLDEEVLSGPVLAALLAGSDAVVLDKTPA